MARIHIAHLRAAPLVHRAKVLHAHISVFLSAPSQKFVATHLLAITIVATAFLVAFDWTRVSMRFRTVFTDAVVAGKARREGQKRIQQYWVIGYCLSHLIKSAISGSMSPVAVVRLSGRAEALVGDTVRFKVRALATELAFETRAEAVVRRPRRPSGRFIVGNGERGWRLREVGLCEQSEAGGKEVAMRFITAEVNVASCERLVPQYSKTTDEYSSPGSTSIALRYIFTITSLPPHLILWKPLPMYPFCILHHNRELLL
jgi:hypothetical protein